MPCKRCPAPPPAPHSGPTLSVKGHVEHISTTAHRSTSHPLSIPFNDATPRTSELSDIEHLVYIIPLRTSPTSGTSMPPPSAPNSPLESRPPPSTPPTDPLPTLPEPTDLDGWLQSLDLVLDAYDEQEWDVWVGGGGGAGVRGDAESTLPHLDPPNEIRTTKQADSETKEFTTMTEIGTDPKIHPGGGEDLDLVLDPAWGRGWTGGGRDWVTSILPSPGPMTASAPTAITAPTAPTAITATTATTATTTTTMDLTPSFSHLEFSMGSGDDPWSAALLMSDQDDTEAGASLLFDLDDAGLLAGEDRKGDTPDVRCSTMSTRGHGGGISMSMQYPPLGTKVGRKKTMTDADAMIPPPPSTPSMGARTRMKRKLDHPGLGGGSEIPLPMDAMMMGHDLSLHKVELPPLHLPPLQPPDYPTGAGAGAGAGPCPSLAGSGSKSPIPKEAARVGTVPRGKTRAKIKSGSSHYRGVTKVRHNRE